jgi:formylglycine-generating enzyme
MMKRTRLLGIGVVAAAAGMGALMAGACASSTSDSNIIGVAGSGAGNAGSAGSAGRAGGGGAAGNAGGAAGQAGSAAGQAGSPAGGGGAAGDSGQSGAAGEAGSAAQGGSAGSGGAIAGCDGINITNVKTTEMVAIGSYQIDKTEVTRSQYCAWLATHPVTTGQPAPCDFNTSFEPDPRCGTEDAGTLVCHGAGCEDHPQICIDWCDAYAYCKGVGKRLCGAIGGGENGYDETENVSTSQWYNACSAHGQNTYPYGGTYNGDACNGYTHGLATTVPVGSMTTCQSSASGFTGVLDMSGNVWEWEDSCDGSTGKDDMCRIRGGSFEYGSPELICGTTGTMFTQAGRDGWGRGLGLRCCSQ